MQETKDNRITIQNGRQLLSCCIYRLNESQRTESGGNTALHPTVIVMMGEKSGQRVQFVKSTLDDNWNNARFIKYLRVVRTDRGLECDFLADVTKEGGPVWEDAGKAWEEALSDAVVSMLETEEKIFSERTTVKMEYLLDATEADGIAYFELYRRTGNLLLADERKTLYLMLDQRPGDGRVGASDRLLEYMTKQNASIQIAGTVWLLSNYLQSGQMLGEGRIWQNYRLAADLMLLGGSRRKAQGDVQRLFHGFKTVSYALVTKPVDEIAAASLRTLMDGLYDMEQKRMYRELPASEVTRRLQMDRYHGFLFLEEVFRKKISAKFPKETDWQYLPFRSMQAYREFLKNDRVTLEAADAVSWGAASAFLDLHYVQPVRRFLLDEKEMACCREQIQALLAEQFSYFELLYVREHFSEVQSMVLAEYQFAGFKPKETACRRLHLLGAQEGRQLFYEKMKQVIVQELEYLTGRAQRFLELYESCKKEIRQECIVTGAESESVEKYYSSVVREYVLRCQPVQEQVSAFPQVFCVEHGKEELLGALWDVFADLAREKVFGYDFEQELDCRMDGMDEKQRHIFVEKELRKRLEGSRRLKNRIEIPLAQAGCYYLVNARADYAKTLAQAQGSGYVLFDLSRTDCIEQLEIYDILKPQQLRLSDVRNQHDCGKGTPGLSDPESDL